MTKINIFIVLLITVGLIPKWWEMQPVTRWIDQWKSSTSNKYLLRILGRNRNNEQVAGYALSTLGLLLVILSLILMAIGSVLTAGEFAGLSEEGEIEGVFTPIFMLAFLLHPVAMYFTFFGYLCGHQANLESYKVHGDRSWFDKSFIKLSAISYSLLGVGYSISFMSELLIAPLIIFAIPVLVELLARFAVNSQINELDKKKIILLEKDTETGATPE